MIGNSPGVRRELTEGIGSLPGWRKGVRMKKIETRQKIIGGSQKACRELGRYKDWTMLRELSRSSLRIRRRDREAR
ncbi:hypothetical protein B296_00013817 [Ensete ventricosum]|uniref:Uncharacterized protein n=1 Tax=Ensete ventricosum TaxID=4639 RepID=A0A426YA87_ENSVE|nr:hypothetical protein B296_00013817 [Ensete ventricosum]